MGPSVGVTRYKGDWELPEGGGGGTWAPPGGSPGAPREFPRGRPAGGTGGRPRGLPGPLGAPHFRSTNGVGGPLEG